MKDQITSIDPTWPVVLRAETHTIVKIPNRYMNLPNGWDIIGRNDKLLVVSIPKTAETIKATSEPTEKVIAPVEAISRPIEAIPKRPENISKDIGFNLIRIPSTWQVFHYSDQNIVAGYLINSLDKLSVYTTDSFLWQDISYNIVCVPIVYLRSQEWANLEHSPVRLYDRVEEIPKISYRDISTALINGNSDIIEIPTEWNIIYKTKEHLIVKFVDYGREWAPVVGHIVYQDTTCIIRVMTIQEIKSAVYACQGVPQHRLQKINLNTLIEIGSFTTLSVQPQQPILVAPMTVPIVVTQDADSDILRLLYQHCEPTMFKIKNYMNVFDLMKNEKYYDKIIQKISLTDFMEHITIGFYDDVADQIISLNLIEKLIDRLFKTSTLLETALLVDLFIRINSENSEENLGEIDGEVANILKCINIKINGKLCGREHILMYKYFFYMIRYNIDYIMNTRDNSVNYTTAMINQGAFTTYNAIETFRAFAVSGSMNRDTQEWGKMMFDSMQESCDIEFRQIIKSNIGRSHLEKHIETYMTNHLIKTGFILTKDRKELHEKVVEYYL